MDPEEPVPGSGTPKTAPGAEAPTATGGLASSTINDQVPSEAAPPQRASRRLLVGVVLALVVVASGIGLAFGLSGTPTTITTGTGSATITWTPVPANSNNFTSPPQPFQGTIEGIMASGVATIPLTASGIRPASPSGALPTKFEIAHWKGIFGGKSFTVGIFVKYSFNESIADPSPAFPTVTIVGQWGTDPVRGKVQPPTAAELKNDNGPIHFTGTVGEFKVSGTVQSPTGRKIRQSQASFTITG
jgi:hypothetical protein